MASIFTGWSMVAVDPDAASEQTQRVLAILSAIAPLTPFPKRHVEPWLFPSDYLPWLVIMDVLPDGEFRTRLVGTRVVERFGRELTGRTLADAVPGEDIEAVYAHYREVVESRTPAITLTNFDTSHGAYSYERLIVPLGDEQSQVRWVLVSITLREVPPRRTMVQVLKNVTND